MAQWPRVEPKTDFFLKNVIKMVPNDILLWSRIGAQLRSSEGLHPAADGSRCGDPQPDISWSLRSSTEEGEEGCGSQRVKSTMNSAHGVH